MESMRSLARRCGVSRGIPAFWGAAGLLGDLIETPNGNFVDDDAAERVANGDVIRTLDDLRQIDPDAAELLGETGVFVARCLPERPRPDAPGDFFGIDMATVARTDQGYRRYWLLGSGSVARIEDAVEAFGGQPMIVTVKGLVAVTTKIVDLHQTPGGYEFTLAKPGLWAAPFADARLLTRPGGEWQWWPIEGGDA